GRIPKASRRAAWTASMMRDSSSAGIARRISIRTLGTTTLETFEELPEPGDRDGGLGVVGEAHAGAEDDRVGGGAAGVADAAERRGVGVAGDGVGLVGGGVHGRAAGTFVER